MPSGHQDQRPPLGNDEPCTGRCLGALFSCYMGGLYAGMRVVWRNRTGSTPALRVGGRVGPGPRTQ